MGLITFNFCVNTNDKKVLRKIKKYVNENMDLFDEVGLLMPEDMDDIDTIYDNHKLLTKKFKDLEFGFFYFGEEEEELGYFIAKNKSIIMDERDIYDTLSYKLRYAIQCFCNDEEYDPDASEDESEHDKERRKLEKSDDDDDDDDDDDILHTRKYVYAVLGKSDYIQGTCQDEIKEHILDHYMMKYHMITDISEYFVVA